MKINQCRQCKGIFQSEKTLMNHDCTKTKPMIVSTWDTSDYPMLAGLTKQVEFVHYADFFHCIIDIRGIRKTGVGETQVDAMIHSLQNIKKEVA